MDWLGNSRTVGGSVRNAGESGWQRFRPLFPTPRMRGAVFLWARTLCATAWRSDKPQRRGRAQGALPQL